MKPRPCRKCATDQPHPFRHWHVWCRYCRKPKIFRGPACASCHARLRELAAEIIAEMEL